jgi:hypothetical protein
MALLCGAAAVVINWDTIVRRLQYRKLRHDDIAVLIREHLANGGGEKVTGILFENTPFAEPYYSESWVGDQMDPVLEQVFKNKKKVEVKL